MKFGAAMFFTDASMPPGELGPILEQRGFESLWVPEHSHIPVVRTKPFPGGPELPRPYYDIMDPFLVLIAAAVATKTLKVGTGVCLINQRDPIQTAKMVASIDQLSNGRFLFGVGNGWDKEEMEHHGTVYATRHKLSRERVEAMKLIWSEETPEYRGEFVNFAPMQTWPKPVQKPHPPVMIAGGGEQLTLRYVARLADACNVGGEPDGVKHKLEVLRRHCDAVQRDYATIEKTNIISLLLARDAAAVKAKRERLSARGPLRGFVGTPAEAIELIGQYQDAGVQLLINSDYRNDMETHELMASEVMPHFG
jgi:probable F420-dependent oxidoreductase